MGFCPRCRADTALEEVDAALAAVEVGELATAPRGGPDPARRLASGVEEVDRVLGGGFVPGSVVLLGGEPGIGKSTLLLEVAAAVAGGAGPVLLVSAEESADQVRLRARRIEVAGAGVALVCEQALPAILEVARGRRPALLVVDSIQTVVDPDTAGAPGGVAQVREAAARLVRLAKRSGTVVVLVGHVTKDGAFAGPKTLEHMVDVVLSLEGDDGAGLRFLRAMKNRFGSVNEVGVFTMDARGLLPVGDPSEVFVGGRDPDVPGTVLFPTVDGRRSLLVEVQALVVAGSGPQPRRSAKGIPTARLHQVLAVLERHAGLSLGRHDVYASVVGGLRIAEPAADLPLALAVASSVTGRPLGAVAAWGEVGLTGELRAVAGGERRRAEAARFRLRTIAAGSGPRRLVDALSAVEAGRVASAGVGARA